MSHAATPHLPTHVRPSLRGMVTQRIESPLFQRAILAVIVVNAIVLGLETSKTAMAEAGPLLVLLDRIALAIFVVEIALKLFAHRASFFRSGWNVFDFLIVALSFAPASEGFAVLRALRILRVLRLVSLIPSLRRVVEGLLAALPGMGFVLGLMSLIFYVAAVMATKLFGATHPRWFGDIGNSAYSLCTAPGSLDNGLHYAAALRLAAIQRSLAAVGLTRPFFSTSHSVL
jgi:voltage-gated sodium channel